MPQSPDFSSLTSAIEKDFAAFSRDMGDGLDVAVHIDQFGAETVIKITHGDCETPIVNAYAKNLKKRFGFITDGEGEEFAVDLVIPTARADDMAAALGNPSKQKITPEFNTVAFTGTLTVSRAEAIKTAKRAGFRVANSISKEVDYLVAGDNPGAKEDKARALGVKILTEPQWTRLLKKSRPKQASKG
jgi:NAD-dependent DNA ligase